MLELLPYQAEYLEGMPASFLMGASVGLGKSAMSLKHYDRHNPGGRLLIVCPASKRRTGDWPREIERFLDYTPDFEVISYEAMSKRVKEFIDPELTIIADECHFVCNATSKRARAFLAIAKASKQWIGLSGTLLPNGWRSAEAYAVLTGLSKNKTDFVGKYVIIDRSRGFPLIMGYRFTDQLEAWWARVSKPLLRTGDMVLPSEMIPVHSPMPPKLARVYKKAVKERYIEHPDGEIELLDNPSKVFTTLRQLPNPVRIDMLQSIIESTDEHIVIFYNFNSERDAVLELLEKSFKQRKIYEQSGHTSHLPPRERWGKLKPSVTLVQYQSGSQAIELTYASVTVYLSPPTSWAMYEQSIGRTRRSGQKLTTLFYHIAVSGTIDKHIWGIVRQKQSFSNDLMAKILDIAYTDTI